MENAQLDQPTLHDAEAEDLVPELCGCGEPAQYVCGEHWTCEACAWSLAEAGGAP